MPRYEFSEGTSNKYWEITLKGTDVITHYGRIGSAGQSTTKPFKSAEEAQKAYDKLIASKLKEGYVEASGGAGKEGGGAGAAKEGGALAKPSAKGQAEKSESPPKDSGEGGALIERLDRWLKEARPTYYGNLKPGASAAEVAKFEQQLGEKLPPALKALFMWKSADQKAPDERFIDNWSLMSLEQASRTWTTLNELKEAGDFDDNGEDWWSEAWVPFLENGSGDNLCVDVKGAVAKKGSVLPFNHDYEDREVQYASLDKMLEEMLKWAEKGNWDIDDDGLANFGREFTPSEEARRGKEKKPEPAKPKAEPKPAVENSDPKTKITQLLELPESDVSWNFNCDVSPDGQHTVYKIEDKAGAVLYIDGKKTPKYENALGPWFDDASGTLVFREGAKGKWRWHIGAEIEAPFVRSQNPVFSADRKKHCYAVMKGKQWYLCINGEMQKESFDGIYDPLWSPDGTKLAFKAEAGSKKFVVNDGVRGPDVLDPMNLVYSPDETKLAYGIRANQPILQYHVVCGDFTSEKLNGYGTPGFTPGNELYYPYSSLRDHGYHVGAKTYATERSVVQILFKVDSTLAGQIEFGSGEGGRGSFLVRANQKPEKIPHYHAAFFAAPDVFAIVGDRMTSQQAMVALVSRMVAWVNGRESVEFDYIKHPRLRADKRALEFSALRGRELFWVEVEF